MSSFLCFICHNTVHDDTNGETREKYRELVGIKLCPDSHLCHICCHLLNKFWLFKTICVRRSMEYPVLFSDKGTISLQNCNTEITILCPKTDECNPNTHANTYHFMSHYEDQYTDSNQYMSLEDRLNITKDTEGDEAKAMNESEYDNHFNNDSFDNVEAQSDQNNEDPNMQDDANVNLESTDDNKIEFHKVILSVEEQRAELEAKRKEDSYIKAEFKCYNCALGFLFKDTYQAHMMRHEESNGEHLCDICTLRFASACVLRAHLASHRERVTCARCGRAVRPRRTHAHRARCAGAYGAPRTPAPCHLCGNTFPDANGLQQHIKRFHLSKTSSKSYSCSVCGKRYTNQGAVRTHMIKHINKKFPCEQCPSTFSSPYTLAQHRKKHSTNEEHRCETCNVTYKSRKSLLAHFRNSMSHQQSIVTCPICARRCPHRRALASHMQTVHACDAPHACALCPARYSSRKSLAAHVRAHAPRTRHTVCHICGARFKGNNKLNRHLRLVCEKAKMEEELAAFYNQE